MLSSGDDFFSDSSMRRRDPLSYDRLVGRHLTPSERAARDRAEARGGQAGPANCSLANIILEHMDINAERDLKKAQENEEALEEFDLDEEEESDKEEEGGEEVDRAVLAEEFRRSMHQRFLDGGDAAFFDYSKVDQDETLDDHEGTRCRDEEDRYFDEEEEEDEGPNKIAPSQQRRGSVPLQNGDGEYDY